MSESRTENILSRVKTINSIMTLFDCDEYWREFFFHHQRRDVRLSARKLLEEAESFKKIDRLLVKVALDFWSEEGGAKLSDILQYFDDEKILIFIKALLQFRDLDLEELFC